MVEDESSGLLEENETLGGDGLCSYSQGIEPNHGGDGVVTYSLCGL